MLYTFHAGQEVGFQLPGEASSEGRFVRLGLDSESFVKRARHTTELLRYPTLIVEAARGPYAGQCVAVPNGQAWPLGQ